MPSMMKSSIAQTTGRLDRVISEMKIHAQRVVHPYHSPFVLDSYDDADLQTLKHHAEDMIAMGNYVLNKVDPNRNVGAVASDA